MKLILKRILVFICLTGMLVGNLSPIQAKEKEIEVGAPYNCMISSITSKGNDVYWKKPAGVDGYEVWRAYSENGKYKRAKVVKDSAVGNWVDNKFNHKKHVVYYKIRAFKYDSKGKKVYSRFSAPREAKYRNKLTMEKSRIFLRSNQSRKLGAYYGWGNATNCVWTSDNEAIATVLQNGRIYGVSKGKCYITCKSDQGTKRVEVIVDREPQEPLTEITSRYVNEDGVWKNPDAKATNDALIMMTGDMMCVGPQQTFQGYATGDYNFNESYGAIKPVIEQSDFAIGNLETTLSDSWPYMHEEGYIANKPNCNAPSRYLDAVKFGGFDAVVMANNHSCDAKVAGLRETINRVDDYKLARTGAFLDKNDDRTLVAEVNGIKVGFLSYIIHETGYNKKDEKWSQKNIDTMLNYFSEDKAKADIKLAKEKGAEFIVVYMHWGVKNDPAIKPSMKNAAQTLADLGVDYIVGGHSHLVQPYKTIVSKKTGKKVPCFYSVGDFQTATDQIVGNRDSVIVRIRLGRDENGKVILKENGYIPCHTYTDYKGGKFVTVAIKSSKTSYKRIVKNIGKKIKPYVE